MTELDRLKGVWLKLTKHDMPDAIASLSLDRIRRAVALTRRGDTVVVPALRPVPQVVQDDDSMIDWDNSSRG